jgi:acyl dehydratase
MAGVSYFEDVEVGLVAETPGRTLTETDVVRYSGLTGDWDTRSTDAEYASGTEVGERCVPDLLPLCISSGLGWRIPHPPLAVLAFMGFEWKFHLPLRIGDTIRCRTRAAAKRSMKDGGIVIEEREVLNQRGELVQWGKVTFLVAKRPPE